jgi:hypothetical protein
MRCGHRTRATRGRVSLDPLRSPAYALSGARPSRRSLRHAACSPPRGQRSLARLRGEIGEDRAAMSRRSADLDDADVRLLRTPGDAAALALAAWAIHGWYTALETLLERLARQLDCELPAGERWHRELLAQ